MKGSTKPSPYLPNLHTIKQTLEALKAQRQIKNRLKFYQPYPKQKIFHDYGATCKQRLLRAGNQQGKTFCGAMEMAMHLTGQYASWWNGRRFDHPVDAWAACDTGETTRDNPQRALLGPAGSWGTGTIPAAALIEAKRGQGVADLVDILQVAHISGGVSTLGFKRYDQGRKAWQGPSKHVIWCDEEPPSDVYDEALARLIATGGMIYTTFTPLLGMSKVVTRLMRAHDGTNCADVSMSLADALHISKDQWQQIASAFPEHERDARLSGIPAMGSGRIFPLAPADIRCRPFEVADEWLVVGGMDFGFDHPFAAVKLAWDQDADCVYVTQTYRQRNQTPAVHAASLKKWGTDLLWAWPHDGLASEKGSGKQLKAIYAEEGLRMLHTHAHMEGAGFRVWPGLIDMRNRMTSGRFKVFDNLADWFAEFESYHLKDGQIVKLNDDLLSATRVALMMLRYAKPQRASSGEDLRNDLQDPSENLGYITF